MDIKLLLLLISLGCLFICFCLLIFNYLNQKKFQKEMKCKREEIQKELILLKNKMEENNKIFENKIKECIQKGIKE